MIIVLFFFLTVTGNVYILQRTLLGDFQQTSVLQAHNMYIDSLALNNTAFVLATACSEEDKVKLWDVKQGAFERIP